MNNEIFGWKMITLTNGFVELGEIVKEDAERYYIKNAINLRIYGTAKGANEISISGPTPQSVLDKAYFNMIVHKIHVIKITEISDQAVSKIKETCGIK